VNSSDDIELKISDMGIAVQQKSLST